MLGLPPQRVVTRTRKLTSLNSAMVQVLLQVSAGPPMMTVVSVIGSALFDCKAVQEVPPSQERSTSILLLPATSSSHRSRRTSMPAMTQPAGIEIP